MTNTTIIIKETNDNTVPDLIVPLIVIGVIYIYLELVSIITRKESITVETIKYFYNRICPNNQVTAVEPNPYPNTYNSRTRTNPLTPTKDTIITYYHPPEPPIQIPTCSICCEPINHNHNFNKIDDPYSLEETTSEKNNLVDMVELDCGHYFHKDCLETWYKENKLSCPNCRLEINVKNFYFLDSENLQSVCVE